LWYIHFNGSVSCRPYKFFSRKRLIWLKQVASLASRHEQITVRAAFFCLLRRSFLRFEQTRQLGFRRFRVITLLLD
jgi:hypothetical protein